MPLFGVQVTGLEPLVAGFQKAPSTIPADVHTAMEISCLLVESNARAKAPRRTGRLAGSITHKISGSGANLTGEIGPSVLYGLYVETGTRPHWMPPGILPYPVMRAIAKKGTRAQPYMAPAFSESLPRIESEFAKLGIAITHRLVAG